MAVIYKHWYQRWWGLALLMFLGLILAFFLAMSFFVYQSVRDLKSAPASFKPKVLSERERIMIEGRQNYGFGAAEPEITIVEFGDYACPYCHKSFSAIRQISLKHADRIKFIFRDYPVSSSHSLLLSLAANCAGEQGLFWNMHDKLFINFGVNDREQMIDLARQIGGDEKLFSACLDSEKHLPLIRQNILDAELLGIKGTPAWFINGHKLEGHIPHQLFLETIENILNNQ